MDTGKKRLDAPYCEDSGMFTVLNRNISRLTDSDTARERSTVFAGVTIILLSATCLECVQSKSIERLIVLAFLTVFSLHHIRV